jgi:predicted amidohydrolase YtcJ
VRTRRHRIEHFPFLKADSVKRAADMGVPVVTQPAFIDVKAEELLARLGADMKDVIHTMVPARTMLAEGVHLGFGADVPAFPSHLPLDGIRCLMERRTAAGRRLDPDETVSFMDALKAHTLGSAHASFDEKELGSLEPGKVADLVVWNKDLTRIASARDLAGLEVDRTYLAGKVVHDRVEAARAGA